MNSGNNLQNLYFYIQYIKKFNYKIYIKKLLKIKKSKKIFKFIEQC